MDYTVSAPWSLNLKVVVYDRSDEAQDYARDLAKRYRGQLITIKRSDGLKMLIKCSPITGEMQVTIR